MKISYNTIPGNFDIATGYGYAGFNMVLALQRLGHEVPYADPNAPVEIYFAPPNFWDWSSTTAHRIGYVPWESTGMPYSWIDHMNKSCDEVWTPSPLVAQWYQDAGCDKEVFVYEHGVPDRWKAKRRINRQGVLRFLHIGEPAPRKGGQMTLDAFRMAFGDRTDVHLTIKAHGNSTVKGPNNAHPDKAYNNVSVITSELETHELIDLYHRHHVMLYPSFGEGFGFIPLQALATGMPTICTEAWAPYKRFILPELRLRSHLAESPWPDMHPGKLFHPDFKHLVDLFTYSADNFNNLSARSFAQASQVHHDYNWDRVTQKAFAHIADKFA